MKVKKDNLFMERTLHRNIYTCGQTTPLRYDKVNKEKSRVRGDTLVKIKL
jgi:hypothetical protein